MSHYRRAGDREARRKRILELLAKGVSVTAVAERFGMSHGGVWQIVESEKKRNPHSPRAGAIFEGSIAQKPT